MATPTRHTLSYADKSYAGNAYLPGASPDGRHGVEMSQVLVTNFGAIGTALTDVLNGATGAELPNATTTTYTAQTDGTAPLDASTRYTVVYPVSGSPAVAYYDLGTARNVVYTATAGTLLALSILFTGLDQYYRPLSELLATTSTGTSKTATGLKAFRYLRSMAIIAAGNLQTSSHAISAGLGVKVGLPVRFDNKGSVIALLDGVVETTQTLVTAVTTDPATTTTGDTRGTITFSAAPNGTRKYMAWQFVEDRSTAVAAFGIAPV